MRTEGAHEHLDREQRQDDHEEDTQFIAGEAQQQARTGQRAHYRTERNRAGDCNVEAFVANR
jgi:hypothetical protein